MTENEAIEILNNECEDISKVQIALKVAREALEEIQQYRAIGTVERLKHIEEYVDTLNKLCADYSAIGTIEEFKALKEKNVAKKSKEVHENEVCIDFICPNCKEAVYGQPYRPNYCKHCGQKLDWQ